MKFEMIEKNARHASMLLKAMSNPHRLLILCQLTDGEKCVGELETIVGLSQSALSQHLARLRRDNLVKTRRSAQTIYYSLAGDDVEVLIDALHGLYQQSHVAVTQAMKKAARPRDAVSAA
ncbi:MAG: metalloregulator ArsR/SmtB family transcription factor [Rhodospirillales bacterium]